MSAAPTLCPECGHRFPPGAPEPSRCPNCGRQCTGYGEAGEIKMPMPDEIPVTPQERGRWRTLFWVCFLVGPLSAVLLMLFQREILASIPASLRPFVEVTSHPFIPLCLSAAGAGICMVNGWFTRRRLEEILAYCFWIGILAIAAYFVISAMVDAPVH